jgi:hypothetical protein
LDTGGIADDDDDDNGDTGDVNIFANEELGDTQTYEDFYTARVVCQKGKKEKEKKLEKKEDQEEKREISRFVLI